MIDYCSLKLDKPFKVPAGQWTTLRFNRESSDAWVMHRTADLAAKESGLIYPRRYGVGLLTADAYWDSDRPVRKLRFCRHPYSTPVELGGVQDWKMRVDGPPDQNMSHSLIVRPEDPLGVQAWCSAASGVHYAELVLVILDPPSRPDDNPDPLPPDVAKA